MKIINTSKKPYEWVFDGNFYGPLKPGEVADFPEEIARHAITRGVLLDDEGQFISYQVEPLGAVDKTRLRQIALYVCPLFITGECTHEGFAKLEDLRAHMDVHFGPPVAAQASVQAPRPAARP